MINKIKKALNANIGSNAKRVSSEEFMQLVQQKAYELYEKRGCKQGNDLEDWLNAERLVKEDIERK